MYIAFPQVTVKIKSLISYILTLNYEETEASRSSIAMAENVVLFK